jgi:hypothetical protein
MITPCHGSLVAVDIDVSPFDNSKTKKEGVRLTRNSMVMSLFLLSRGRGISGKSEIASG